MSTDDNKLYRPGLRAIQEPTNVFHRPTHPAVGLHCIVMPWHQPTELHPQYYPPIRHLDSRACHARFTLTIKLPITSHHRQLTNEMPRANQCHAPGTFFNERLKNYRSKNSQRHQSRRSMVRSISTDVVVNLTSPNSAQFKTNKSRTYRACKLGLITDSPCKICFYSTIW